MADEPHWADIASAIGTCATGLVAAYLSWRAYSLEKSRLKHELLPERKKLEKELLEIIDSIYKKHPRRRAEGLAKIDASEVEKLSDLVIRSNILFGRKVQVNLVLFDKVIQYLYFNDFENKEYEASLYNSAYIFYEKALKSIRKLYRKKHIIF